MGLVLAPLIIFWLTIALYSLNMGYALISDSTGYPNAVSVIAIALFSLLIYLRLGFARFKSRKKLLVFEIPIYFTTNKVSFFLVILAILAYKFGSDYLSHEYLKPIPFILTFTISFAAIIGTFYSETFIKKYKITQIH
ncbi:hypothetical protein [Thalassomonas actiniarum]|uniref:Uncharacterized protein n=1 Tax=Thalassomonas actiniarum TaxID=485447 RepID=A0AAF0C331_9GAMM|nr:hypothetical protein [Thalassomonas actiniarum]WDD98485.1 hypothetical protein SG35_025050 [Thalassomonas actiniarum]